MEEASKVRLVRCPKCENLLPELPDFSVYQCGGCGAVLRAKNKGIQEGEMSGKSDNAKDDIGNSEDSKLAKDSKSDPKSRDKIEVERIGDERAIYDGNSSSSLQNRDVFANSDTNRTVKEERQESLERDRFKNHELNADSPGRNDLRTDRLVRSQVESLMSLASRGHARNSSAAQGRFSNFHHHNEDQLSCDTTSHYRARDLSQELDGLARIEKSEPGRADLLRRIDDLKDQLSRSSDVGGKHKVSCSTASDTHGGYFLGSSSDSNVRTRQPLASDDSFLHRNEPGFVPPRMDMYSTSLPDSYPWERTQYNDSYRAEMIRRNYYHLHHPNPQYTYRPYREDFQGYYGDYNHDDFALHHRENLFHQSACSCPQCCNKNWFLPPRIGRVGSHNRRNNMPNNPSNIRMINGNNHRSNLLHAQPSMMNPCDFDSENEGFLNYQRPRKCVVAQRSGRVSYPVAGGAPFITCNNCFELLKLPRKHFMMRKDRHEIKCGSCSSVISFEPGGHNEVISSVSADIEPVSSEIDERCSSETFDENIGYGNNFLNISDVDESQLTKLSSPFEKKSNSQESEKQLDSFSSTSCDEKIPENNNPSRKHGSSLSEIPLETINSLLHPSDHRDSGNKSTRSERERVSSLGRNSSRQICSSKDASVETEDDMPLHEISNNHTSIETHTQDHSKAGNNKTGKSFIASLIKKSFRDSTTKPNQVLVFVNGHMIPHDLVKKAEKMAGPIQPGEYWYDKRAGFWGVMGHPCSGIIMPNIEEFNYPLLRYCAAGNTGIFVNGRELHQQDLDLLANRGLPITRNRSYLIEITGEVVDERSGEELDPLGKLAPTVEKAKRGFGMKVPKAVR